MAEKLRIGIIGCGGIAHSHMRAYQKMDDVEIVAGADIVPGKARAFLDEFGLNNVPAYESHVDMLEKVQMELRTSPRPRQYSVMASSRARFSLFCMAGTVLEVKVKSIKG